MPGPHPVLIAPAIVGALMRAAQLLFIALVIVIALAVQAARFILGIRKEY